MLREFLPSTITASSFGQTLNGIEVELYTLTNHRGMVARIATYGGIVTSLLAADREGLFADVVLGYDTLAGYLKSSPYFGAMIGRYANRIARGRFTLGGNEYTLALNDARNSLHGGREGFDKVVWDVTEAAVSPQGPRLGLAHTSADGEEGYPGALAVSAIYTLTEDDALMLQFRATTDRDTVVNLTQHSYFNLGGPGDILKTLVQINAETFTPVNDEMIPTGEIRPVAGTPFDFRTPVVIGARINAEDGQLMNGSGYDHNWIVDKPPNQLGLMATACDPDSGRTLEVSSTAPGLQFYTGNKLDGSITGKGNRTYGRRDGFTFEPQHFPDSPNRENFPSTVLRRGEIYEHTIRYKFRACISPLTDTPTAKCRPHIDE